ncbi:hypothetical protein [Butyrivibrio sp. NC2002]|uniref:hypothetical protein n=1 Tax=Butyrivibrio sp. NC2002 TaxID=1410610 RepID=UPI00055D3A15|nr:hypothetical protein [Butyrivibrio sp. NC2002]
MPKTNKKILETYISNVAKSYKEKENNYTNTFMGFIKRSHELIKYLDQNTSKYDEEEMDAAYGKLYEMLTLAEKEMGTKDARVKTINTTDKDLYLKLEAPMTEFSVAFKGALVDQNETIEAYVNLRDGYHGAVNDVMKQNAEAELNKKFAPYYEAIDKNLLAIEKIGKEADKKHSEEQLEDDPYTVMRVIHSQAQYMSTIGLDKHSEMHMLIKRNLVEATREIMEFYQNNLFSIERRYAMDSEEKLQDLTNAVNRLLTENQTYLSEIEKNDHELGAALGRYITNINDTVTKDMNALIQIKRYNDWKQWEGYKKELQIKEDTMMYLGKKELMEKHGLTTDDQFFYMVMMNLDKERFDRFPHTQKILDVLGIKEDDVPENLRKDLVDLKEKMMLATTTTIAHYVKDTDPETGKQSTHYLNYKELTDLGQIYRDCIDGVEAFNKKLAENNELNTESVRNKLDELDQSFRKTYSSVDRVIGYIELNANKEEKDTIRPFSMYEIDGQTNPEFGNNLFSKIETITAAGDVLVSSFSEKERKNKAVSEQIEQLTEMKNALNKLKTQTIPNMLVQDKETVLKLVTKEDIANNIKDFQDASLKMFPVIKDLEKKLKEEKIKPQERELYEKLAPVYAQLSQKYLLLEYLLNPDNADTELKRDMDMFNDAVSRKETLKKVPDSQIQFFNYVGTCRELMNKGQMFPQFLFEDPLSDRANAIVSLQFAKQNRDAFEERARSILTVPWSEAGTKNLSNLEEYKIRNLQAGEEGQIVQYATKNDRAGFEEVLNKSLENFPDYLGKDVVQRIRDYYHSISTFQGFDGEELQAPIEGICANFDKYDEGGFLNAFSQQELDAGYSMLRDHVQELNANLINAGFNATARRRLSEDPSIPTGYNLGKAKAVATNVFGVNNTAKVSLLSDANMPMSGGQAKQNQYVDIVVGAVDKNYNATSKLPKDGETVSEEFYTTTKDFRRSDFVAFMGMEENPADILAEAQGKSEEEIKQLVKDKMGKLSDNNEGSQKKFTNKLISIDVFDNAENLANMADLQVMHYLSGIKKIGVDDLRIGFKTDESGNLEVSSITGANTKDAPFRMLTPLEEKRLIQPEDMLVMTEEMKEKVLRWAKDEPEFTPEEKEQFDLLPQASFESFRTRVRTLATVIKNSENYNFAQKDPVHDGKLYASLTTERGKIRVLKREDFKNLHIDDLAIGKNNVADKTNKNIFDAMADLPEACNEALIDKWKAKWALTDSKDFGTNVSPQDIARHDVAGFVPAGVEEMNKRFYKAEQQRFMDKCLRITGKVIVMDKDRSKEYFAHWFFGGDTKKYTNVRDAGEKLDNAVTYAMRLRDLETQERKYPQAFHNTIPDERERTEIKNKLKAYREEILKRAQQFAIDHDYNVPEHYNEIPEPILETLKLYPVKDALVNYQSKLEVYLKKREGGRSSDFGNDRYAHMLGIYKDVNERLAEYAAVTGDTSVLPKVAVIDENKKVTFKPLYNTNLEYKMNIPPHVKDAINHKVKIAALYNEIQPMQLYDAPANNNNKKKEINININKIDIDNVKAEPLMENDGNEIIIDEPKKSKVNKTNVNKIMKEQNIVINQKIIVNRDNKKSNIIENEIVKKQ